MLTHDTFFRRIALPLALAILCLMLATRNAHAQSTHFTVADAGTVGKPDIVLIPGLSSSRTVWDAETKLLAPNYRLHLLQINGFAGQPAGANAQGPLLAAIVEDLHTYITAGKMHPAVIGHSLGGLLTLMLEDKYPMDVRKAVIVDALPFYAVLADPAATVETITPQLAAMRQQIESMPADQYAAMQPMMAAALVKNADAQKLVAASSTATDRAVMLQAMTEDMTTDLRSHLASIKTPTLVLYPFEQGKQGAEPSKIDALYVGEYRLMPGATLKRIDDSRHFIMYDQPAAFDAAVELFLK